MAMINHARKAWVLKFDEKKTKWIEQRQMMKKTSREEHENDEFKLVCCDAGRHILVYD